MFKSPDQKRQEKARDKQRVCENCGGTGTIGVGGSGAWSSAPCRACGGSGQK